VKEETAKFKILVVEDEEQARRTMSDVLLTWGYDIETTENGQQAYERISKFHPTVILCDYEMPEMDGMALLNQLKEDALLEHTNFIMMSSHGTIDMAVEAVKKGASDFLRKPLDLVRLKLLLEKVTIRVDIEREVRALRDKVRRLGTFGKLNGTTPQMKNVFKQVQIIGPTTAAVLITGESGTGKQVVAKAIHSHSNRKDKPFLTVNCGAIPENLLEDELFGHEKGAIERAATQKAGFFEVANGGTLFLDEIDQMPSDIQARILEVLETGGFHRIGGKTEIQTDVRVVAATNASLDELVEEKSFSAELFYRLNVFTVQIPPLRDREEDIPLLAQHFIEEFNLKNDRQVKGLTKKALTIIKKYSWPGNVRELKNTIERAVIVCQSDFIEASDLPETLTSKVSLTPTIEFRLGQTVAEVEKHFLFHTINHVNGNKTKASKILGISLKTLHNKLNKYKSSI